MRVVVGSDNSRDFRQAELEKHLEAMSRFIEAQQGRPEAYCTLVLRSAASAPAHALTLMKDSLVDAGARVRAILAKLEPTEDFQQFFATLSALMPEADATSLIRWARNRSLLEAHEQVTYGSETCWSGDAMRRDADKRNPLVLFETHAPESARRASQAFEALWRASAAVPRHYFSGRPSDRPAAAYDPATGTPLTTMRPHVQGWPLVRH